MSLQKRIEQLEQRSPAKGLAPLCIFLVALRPPGESPEDAPRVTGYTSGDRSWTRGEAERADEFKRRVVADVDATGRPALIAARYEEVTA